MPFARATDSLSIHPPLRQSLVSVDAPVAQERPVRAGDVHFGEVHGNDEIFLFVGGGSGKDLAGGAGHEALPPELDAVAAGRSFEADAVGGGDIATIGDRVA